MGGAKTSVPRTLSADVEPAEVSGVVDGQADELAWPQTAPGAATVRVVSAGVDVFVWSV
ncbi:hypothetical protein [Streptomyces sp. NPDC007905]|uniref:hypothetical protein n=1 Tax=Streptomyces sp. NPDC007905 TaxID=3364788 RepID=UPI0036EBC9F1